MKTTKVTKKQLEDVILEEVNRQKRIAEIENKKRKLQEEIDLIDEGVFDTLGSAAKKIGQQMGPAINKALTFAQAVVNKAKQENKKVGLQWLKNVVRNKFKLKDLLFETTTIGIVKVS